MGIAWVFPGQGSQKLGMATAVLDLPDARQRFALASELLGRDLLAICAGEGLDAITPPTDLNDTRNTQPALFVIESLLVDGLRQQGRSADLVAGHSLGELVALYAAGVKPGSSAAVFGCGGVGDSVIQGARLGGATTIIAVDIDPQKLEWAKQFGATHTVNPKEVDAVAKIKEITGGNGANFTFEAVGKVQTLEQALWSRDLAGTCVFIGVPGPGPTLNLPLQKFFDLGGHLCVSWYGDCLPSRDFPLLADWYRQGQLKLDEVVTRTVSLDEVEEAFAAMERGETLRSVIVF